MAPMNRIVRLRRLAGSSFSRCRAFVGQSLPRGILISRPHCRPLHAGRRLRGCGRMPIGGPGLTELALPAARAPGMRLKEGLAMEIRYAGFWGALRTFPKRRPFATNLIVSVSVYGAADYVTQRLQGNELDLRRLMGFSIFGGLSGCTGWLAYITVFSKLCPNAIRFANRRTLAEKLRDKAGLRDLFKQVALDTFVYTPFVFFPLFYMSMKIIKGGCAVCSEPVQSTREALRTYRDNFVLDNVSCASVFLWADIIIFTVPAYMRLPTIQTVNFVYMMGFSWMRGNENKADSNILGSQIMKGADDSREIMSRWTLSFPSAEVMIGRIDFALAIRALHSAFAEYHQGGSAIHRGCFG